MKAVSHVNNEFRQHASPESIRYHLQRAQANRDRWQREVNQLEELLAERLGQIERGEWPPRRATLSPRDSRT